MLSKTLFRCTILLLAFLLFGGCGSGDQTLEIAVSTLGPTADPTRTAALSNVIIGSAVYESLLRQDDRGQPQPNLATSWTYDESGTHLTIRLREGVRFHDGTALSGKVITRLLTEMMEAAGSEGWSAATPALLGDPVSIEATGPYSLEITLPRPHRPLLRMLSTPTITPIRKPGPARNSLVAPAGTGPYRFVRYAPSDSIAVLSVFEDYWGPRPHAERIVFRSYANASDGVDALTRGEIDISALFSLSDVNRVNRSPEIHLASSRAGTYMCIGLNGQRPPFDDKRARQALSLAFDREGLAESYYRAAAVPTRSYIGRHLFPEVVSPRSPAQDLEKAMDRIRSLAHLTSTQLRFVVPPASTPSRVHWLNRPMLEFFSSLGLDVELIQTKTYDEFVRRVDEGDWEMSWDGLNSDTRDLYEFLHVLYGAPAAIGGFGLFGISDPRVPALIDSGRVQRSDSEAAAFYRQALERVASYVPCIPFIDLKGFMAYEDEVQDLRIQDEISLDLVRVRKKGWR